MILDQANAWRSPQTMSQPETRLSDAAPPAGVSASEWARHQRMIEDSNAWRTPPVQDAPGPEVAATTQAMQSLPPGRFPMSAGVGSPCDLNGERGTLQPDGSGYLVCKVTRRVGPTRSSEPARGTDSAITGDRSAQDAAWREMVEAQQNAWRTAP
jgi:hypothetical protein